MQVQYLEDERPRGAICLYIKICSIEGSACKKENAKSKTEIQALKEALARLEAWMGK